MTTKPSTQLLALATLATLLAAMPALADVSNGDFENGGFDWAVNAPADWGVSFPAAGGNPDGYASIRSPFSGPGGTACIIQTFTCGDPDSGTECTVGFDYRLDIVDAGPGTGRIVVWIGGVESVVVEGQSDWETVSYVVPCGVQDLGLCLEVDDENNSWQACFDNVRAECTGPVSTDAHTWTNLKSLFR